jgi:putative salt-induced outer membrane protein YdiY
MLKYFILLALCFPCHAQINIMQSLYMSDTSTSLPDSHSNISATGELGLLYNDGNTNSSSTNAKLNISHELDTWSYQTIASVRHATSEEEDDDGETYQATSAQKNFISTQIDFKLTSPDERIFIYLEYENDRFDTYDYQTLVASGWSERLWQDDVSEFKYSVGPGYSVAEANDDEDSDDLSGIILRTALEYTLEISKSAQFRQFFSTETDPEYTKTKSETSLSTKVFGSLAMKLSFVMEHNSHADVTEESLDTETAVTLVYQFF